MGKANFWKQWQTAMTSESESEAVAAFVAARQLAREANRRAAGLAPDPEAQAPHVIDAQSTLADLSDWLAREQLVPYVTRVAGEWSVAFVGEDGRESGVGFGPCMLDALRHAVAKHYRQF